MAGAGPLFEMNKLTVLTLLRGIVVSHGHAPAGVVAEAVMAAVTEFVRETQGPEAAFNVLSRHADAAAAPALAERFP